jgi:hypothetical protein
LEKGREKVKGWDTPQVLQRDCEWATKLGEE